VRVYVVLRQDFEGGTDGHEWAPNVEVLAVYDSEEAARTRVVNETNKALTEAQVDHEDDLTVGFEVACHWLWKDED
jgi:hypothetical protein